MEFKDVSAFVTIFKGAALSCLTLMWLMRHDQRNWTRNQLSDLTGWKQESVAQGLRRLLLHDLVLRIDRETWQLADRILAAGFSLENGIANYPRVDLIDSEHGSSLKHGIHEYDSDHDKEPLPCGVEKIDSHVVRDSIDDWLIQQLIRCGTTPSKATEAISQACASGSHPKAIELRIMWWRVYCLAHRDIKFPGNLIAARVAAGIDTPEDFGIFDIPDRYYELGQELEDLRREIESARLKG